MDLEMGTEIINQGSLFFSKVKWNGLGNMGSVLWDRFLQEKHTHLSFITCVNEWFFFSKWLGISNSTGNEYLFSIFVIILLLMPNGLKLS